MKEKKRFAEKELLAGITPHNSHADELATLNEKEWGANWDKGESNRVSHSQKSDVIETTKIELERGRLNHGAR